MFNYRTIFRTADLHGLTRRTLVDHVCIHGNTQVRNHVRKYYALRLFTTSNYCNNRQELPFLPETQLNMIQSLSRLSPVEQPRPSKLGRGRNPKIRQSMHAKSTSIQGIESNLQSTDISPISKRRIRQLIRAVKDHTLYDLDGIWNAYMAVHADSAALKQIPAVIFAAIRELMHQTVDVLGLYNAASRVCLVSKDQENVGIAMSQVDHTIHMWGLYQLRRYNEIEAKFDALLNQDRQSNGPPLLNQDIWHFRLTALLKANKLERMMDIARKRYRTEQQPLDASTAASLLIHIMRRNQINRAVALLHQMHPLPERILPKDIEQYGERIEFNLDNSVFAHNILLSEFAKRDCPAIAQWFLTRMREQHINVLPFSITSMLNAVAQSKKVTSAMLQVLFAELTALCPKLDAFGYNTFTYHFMARGCKEEAYEVLARMREANIYPDECTFSILIHACVKQQDWQAAKTLIAQMRSLNLTPSPDLYGVLMGGYARIRDIDGMTETLREMSENNVTQSLVIWNCTLSMVARSNNLPGTLYVFNCIRKLRLPLDKYTFWWVFYVYRWTICRVQRDFNRTEYTPKSFESYNISDNELQLPFSLLAEMKELDITIDTKLAYLINFVLYRITQLRRLKSTHIDMNTIADQ